MLTGAGATVLVATQSTRIGRLADRTLILGGDRPHLEVVAAGPPEEGGAGATPGPGPAYRGDEP